MAILIGSQTVVFDDRTLKVSSGATRPASPVTGMFWYNTALSQLEVWNGTAWKAQNVVAGGGGGGTDPQNAYAWGLNSSTSSGRLGDGTTINKSSPVSILGNFQDWVQITGSQDHTAAVRANGSAWCWGRNNNGRVGDGTTAFGRTSPVSVVGGFTDWVQISAGGGSTSAVRANGTAWGWGSNTAGLIGNGTTIDRSSPVAVVGGFTDWVQISVSGSVAAAIRANGTAWTWGQNNYGRLGDGTTIARSSPVAVVGGFTDWVQISAGNFNGFGIRANGTAWAWGSGSTGRLGNGTTTNTSSPVSVVGGFTDWVQIAGAGSTGAGAIRG